MRKVIVNNFVTVDGYYEAKDKTIDGLFEYYHADYAGGLCQNSVNMDRNRRTWAGSAVGGQ